MTYYWRASRNGHDYADTTGAVLSPVLSPSGELAYKRQTDGAAIIPDRLYAFPGEIIPTWGIAPCAWGDDGTLYILNTPIGILLVIAPDGSRRTFDMNPLYPGLLPAALGLHHINAQGIPILPNDPSVAHLVIHNVECWDIDRDDDGTIVCLGDGGAPDGKGSVNLIKPDGTVLMWLPPHDILTPPFISQGRVAISGFDTPEPGAVPWVPFQKFAPVDPVVTLPPNPRPMIRKAFGTPGLPAETPIPIDGYPYLSNEQLALGIGGVIWTPFPDNGRTESVALAKGSGFAVVVDDDGHDVQAELDQLTLDGVAWVHAINCYPGPKFAKALLTLRSSLRPMLAVRACYNDGGWTDAELADSWRLLDAVLEDFRYPFGELIALRPSTKPWMRAYAEARTKQTPAPDLALWPRTVIPPPMKPPQPPVDHVKPGPTPVPKPARKHPRWKFWK